MRHFDHRRSSHKEESSPSRTAHDRPVLAGRRPEAVPNKTTLHGRPAWTRNRRLAGMPHAWPGDWGGRRGVAAPPRDPCPLKARKFPSHWRTRPRTHCPLRLAVQPVHPARRPDAAHHPMGRRHADRASPALGRWLDLRAPQGTDLYAKLEALHHRLGAVSRGEAAHRASRFRVLIIDPDQLQFGHIFALYQNRTDLWDRICLL